MFFNFDIFIISFSRFPAEHPPLSFTIICRPTERRTHTGAKTPERPLIKQATKDIN
jgi:hypothetical protein